MSPIGPSRPAWEEGESCYKGSPLPFHFHQFICSSCLGEFEARADFQTWAKSVEGSFLAIFGQFLHCHSWAICLRARFLRFWGFLLHFVGCDLCPRWQILQILLLLCLGEFCGRANLFFMLGRILWEPNFVGAELCGGRNLWKTKF